MGIHMTRLVAFLSSCQKAISGYLKRLRLFNATILTGKVESPRNVVAKERISLSTVLNTTQ